MLNWFGIMKFTLVKMSLIAVVVSLSACLPSSPSSTVEQKQQEQLIEGTKRVAQCMENKCERLDLSFVSVEDYSVLNEMPYVRTLILRYNKFPGLHVISNMTLLTNLHIEATGIRDVSTLPNFVHLKSLTVRSGLAEDMRTVVPRLPDLRALQMNLPSDGDIQFASSLIVLQTLSLHGSLIADLSPLNHHPSLKYLELHVGLPTDLSPLLSMPKLQKLLVGERVIEEDDGGVFDALENAGVIVETYYDGPIS